jgi:hypothetical protein
MKRTAAEIRAEFKAAVEAKLKAAGTPTRKGSNPESRLVTAILDALALQVKGGRFWRVNSGRVRSEGGRLIQLAPAGTADILGILAPSGRFVGLEVKVPGRKATAVQEEWAKDVRGLGGFVATVTSIDEALGAVERARKGGGGE